MSCRKIDRFCRNLLVPYLNEEDNAEEKQNQTNENTEEQAILSTEEDIEMNYSKHEIELTFNPVQNEAKEKDVIILVD